jgi:EAL domain-containing protein (putative c-di-GMP-specific phosphodiesterase class I)
MGTRIPRRSSDRLQPARRPRRDTTLEAAIEDGRFTILFQPQIDPLTGAVAGAEALARWEGAGSADELFQRAAAGRLDERLSRTLQRRALEIAAAWTGALSHLTLSLNILPQDLAREGYERWLLRQLAEVALDPARLTVEIVESALVVDKPAIADRLAVLREAGIQVAVDDFGTGYANLAYLTSLPLDAMKIDRGLVADLVGGSRDRIVVKAMIGMARELGLKVVVEGVETRAQLQLLADWGVDLYQGFLGAGALSEEELARFVAASAGEAEAA